MSWNRWMTTCLKLNISPDTSAWYLRFGPGRASLLHCRHCAVGKHATIAAPCAICRATGGRAVRSVQLRRCVQHANAPHVSRNMQRTNVQRTKGNVQLTWHATGSAALGLRSYRSFIRLVTSLRASSRISTRIGSCLFSRMLRFRQLTVNCGKPELSPNHHPTSLTAAVPRERYNVLHVDVSPGTPRCSRYAVHRSMSMPKGT